MKKFKEFLNERLNESTFESEEVALYDGGDDGLTHIMKKKDGSYYCRNNKFDFLAEDLAQLKWKLNNYGYHCISGKLDE